MVSALRKGDFRVVEKAFEDIKARPERESARHNHSVAFEGSMGPVDIR